MFWLCVACYPIAAFAAFAGADSSARDSVTAGWWWSGHGICRSWRRFTGVGLLHTLLGRAGAGSLPPPAGAASVIFPFVFHQPGFHRPVSILVGFAMVVAASRSRLPLPAWIPGCFGCRRWLWISVVVRQAITIPIGGGIPHLTIRPGPEQQLALAEEMDQRSLEAEIARPARSGTLWLGFRVVIAQTCERR